jgi:hypothetical protein
LRGGSGAVEVAVEDSENPSRTGVAGCGCPIGKRVRLRL